MALLKINTKLICCEHTTTQLKYQYRADSVNSYSFLLTKILRKILYPFSNTITLLTKSDYSNLILKSNYVRMPNPVIVNYPNNNFFERKNIVLFVGRVDAIKHKGLDILMKVWNSAVCKNPSWELHLVGPYSQKTHKILTSILKKDIQKSVKFIGYKKNINEYMQNSKVFICTSRVEGFPMTLCEALSNKMCCISFDCLTGPNELIINEFNGIIVPNNDISQMIFKLNQLLNDKRKQLDLSNNAHYIIKKYEVEKVVDRWEILFKKLVSM